MHKLLYTYFYAVVLLITLPGMGIAQVNITPNYSSAPGSSGATNRNRTDVPAVSPNSELRVVPPGLRAAEAGTGISGQLKRSRRH